MPMDRRPFEIVAECMIARFPTGADIGQIREQIESARASRPEVVRAAVNPPAIYRGTQYVLQTRFVAWAEDNAGAIQAVEGLMQDAGVPCRSVLPSGRALSDADVPPPPQVGKPGRAASTRGAPGSKRRPQTRKIR